MRSRTPTIARRARPHSYELAEGRRFPSTKQVSHSGMVMVTPGLGKRLRDLEYLADLAVDRRYRVYDRMRRSDSHIAGLMTALDLPLVDATWRVEPADESATAKEIAEAVSEALFVRLFDEWPQVIQNVLLYPAYGYAAFEVCWKIEDGKAWFDRFAWLPPTTMKDIHIERGRVDFVEQYPVDRLGVGNVIKVPGEKLMWFTNEKEGDDWRGVSIMRSMHKDWFAKEKAQVMFLILAERMGGVLMIKTPKNATADDKAAADDLGHRFRIGENVYVRTPEGWDVSLEATPLQLNELREFIKDCNEALSGAVLAQYLDLGKTDTGSRSLGATLSEAFLNTVQARGKYIASAFNTTEGPIEQFVTYNYGAAAARDIKPTLEIGRVSRMNLAATTDALQKLAACGYPMSQDLWEFIAEEAEFPHPDAALAQKMLDLKLNPPQPAGARGPIPGQQKQSPEGKREKAEVAAAEGDGGEDALARAREKVVVEPADDLELADGGTLRRFWRTPRGPELYMQLDEISALLDGAKDELRRRTAAARAAQAEKLVERAETAVRSGDPDKVAALARQSVPGEDRIAAVLRGVFTEWVEAGRLQVFGELTRQREGLPVVKTIITARDKTSPKMVLAEPPQADPDEVAKMVEATARAMAASISAATRSGAVNAAMRAVTALTFLAGIKGQTRMASDTASLRVGLSVSRFVNMGRAIAASQEAESIVGAIYSALQDKNTCPSCKAKDGATTSDLILAEGWTPNPECLGVLAGGECRCLSVYVYDEEVLRAVPANLAPSIVAAEEPTLGTHAATPRKLRRSTRYISDERGAIVGKEELEYLEE